MYELEHLHPGWFRRRKYRTLAGIYPTLQRAQQAVDTHGAEWKPYMLTIGRYEYQIGVECHPFGCNSAWWRITGEGMF